MNQNVASTRPVSASQVQQYFSKSREFLKAAQMNASEDLPTAAASLAVHAGISAADAICGYKLGVRARSHIDVGKLLGQCGASGTEAAKIFGRLIPFKNKSQYDPDQITPAKCQQCQKLAEKITDIAARVIGYES